MSDKLEQLEFKLDKILGFRNMQENLEKYVSMGSRFCFWFRFSCLLTFSLKFLPIIINRACEETCWWICKNLMSQFILTLLNLKLMLLSAGIWCEFAQDNKYLSKEKRVAQV